METNNVVLFPKWKEKLEAESLQAIKEKQYDVALNKLEKLIAYKVNHQEILIAKTICLMELKRYDEAESFIEALVRQKDSGYFHYMHIYLTILFQTNQYKELMAIVDEELNSYEVPSIMKEQFEQLYVISQNMYRDLADEHAQQDYLEFERALDEQDDHRQWVLIRRLQSKEAAPRETMYRLLETDTIGPVVKTALLLWMKEQAIDRVVQVAKFGKQRKIHMKELQHLEEDLAQREILFRLRHIENEDPTRYQMIETLCKQYLYVRYPFSLLKADIPYIADALHIITKTNLTGLDELSKNNKTTYYIEEIRICQAMYLAVIEG